MTAPEGTTAGEGTLATAARLCAPAYELGEYADPVTELSELEADPRAAAELTAPAAGFDTYHWSDATMAELMAVSVQRTLAKSGLAGSEVEMVLLVTDSLPRDRTAHREADLLLEETGLTGATVMTTGLMDCATAMATVGTAAALVDSGAARNVLVVSGDLADRATGGHRIVAGGTAIASDAAASVLVSSTLPGLPVLGMAHYSAADLQQDSGPRQQLLSRMAMYRELFTRLGTRRAFRREDVRAVLPSNFARNVVRTYLADVGYGPEQLALDNVGRIAHCLGSDPLINLADRQAEKESGGAPEAGEDDKLVLLGAGVSHLAAVLVGAQPLPAAQPLPDAQPPPGAGPHAGVEERG